MTKQIRNRLTKWWYSHIQHVSHTLVLLSADDTTINCWWNHKCNMQCNDFNANMQKAICNLLDIDFINSHIHGQSCKNQQQWQWQGNVSMFSLPHKHGINMHRKWYMYSLPFSSRPGRSHQKYFNLISKIIIIILSQFNFATSDHYKIFAPVIIYKILSWPPHYNFDHK